MVPQGEGPKFEHFLPNQHFLYQNNKKLNVSQHLVIKFEKEREWKE